MRSSSIKSLVAAFSIVIALHVAVPAAAAPRGAKQKETVSSRAEIVVRLFMNLIMRIGGIIPTGLPSIPPGDSEETSDTAPAPEPETADDSEQSS